SDDLIAGLLNRNGLKTGNGNRWTRERVTSMRSSYHIPMFKPADDGIEPWLNLGNAAKLLKIAPKTLRLAAQAGQIEAFHPLSEGPWIFARASLITTAAQSSESETHTLRWYYLASGFLVLNNIGAFGIVSRLYYGEFQGGF